MVDILGDFIYYFVLNIILFLCFNFDVLSIIGDYLGFLFLFWFKGLKFCFFLRVLVNINFMFIVLGIKIGCLLFWLIRY